MKEQWKGFKTGKWMNEISIENFMQLNYRPYEGDESFLEGPTERTRIVVDLSLIHIYFKQRHKLYPL